MRARGRLLYREHYATMTGQLSISVIIPTLRRSETLLATLDSLAEDARAWGGSVEVVVVCDGEDEDTRHLTESYRTMPVNWVFHDENRGQAAARNTGAYRATGDLLLFLDDDTEPAAGLLEAHARTHSAAETKDARFRYVACGRIVESAQSKQTSKTGEFLERAWIATLDRFERALLAAETDPEIRNTVQLACFGLNCSMRRQLFKESRGFNELLRCTAEDMEYGARLAKRGVRFLPATATVFHRNEKDLVSYFREAWRMGGTYDALRATDLGQRDAQTRDILNLDTGAKLERITNRVFWHAHEEGCAVAKTLRKLTDTTGSRFSFRLWHDAERLSQYWAGVQESGVTREQLRALAGVPVRVLMLHSISEPASEDESSYYLSPHRFRILLERMRDGAYHCVDPKKLEDQDAAWQSGEVVLTFDDGYDDFYTEIFPLIGEHQLKPLVFLPVDWIGKTNAWDSDKAVRSRKLMTLHQIRELQRYGVRFGSHTNSHPSMPSLGPDSLWHEVSDSKKRLEDMLGDEVSTFAYPFGETNRRVRAAVIEAGYKLAFTTTEGLNIWQDPFAILRTEINERVAPWSYGIKLRTGVSARQSIKQELRPMWHVIPREVRAPLVKAWRSRRS